MPKTREAVVLPQTEKYLNNLGNRIRLARLRRNLSVNLICERAYILPPQSMIGEIKSGTRSEIIEESILYKKYKDKVDNYSASEQIKEMTKKDVKNDESSKKKEKSWYEKLGKRVARRAESRVFTRIFNAIWKRLFK